MKNEKIMLLVDFAMACVLSSSIYLLGSIDIIRKMDPWFYIVFTPIIFFLLYKKRTKEDRKKD